MLPAHWLNSTDKCFFFLTMSWVLLAACSGLCLKPRGSVYLSNCFWLPSFQTHYHDKAESESKLYYVNCLSVAVWQIKAQRYTHTHMYAQSLMLPNRHPHSSQRCFDNTLICFNVQWFVSCLHDAEAYNAVFKKHWSVRDIMFICSCRQPKMAVAFHVGVT